MKRRILSLLTVVMAINLSAQTVNEFIINTNKLGAEIPATLYGHFFEDINFGADGGLYAELIKNRSFEFPQSFMVWETMGNVTLKDDGPFERCPHYVRLSSPGHKAKNTAIVNEGFFGIGLKEGRLTLDTAGPLDLEHVSLFPTDTYGGRENGLRRDMVEALKETSPGVFRFPGGCVIEGTTLSARYDWKKSLGPVENRPLNENRWNFTFHWRMFPDYFQTYGMGYYELFQLAEDMGAEPLPVVNCGLACQLRNDPDDLSARVPLDELESYIQDAIDLIEFANGDVSTTWGKIRADMGHPQPFGLKYIGIGNEQWGTLYIERFKMFVEALRRAHPEICIVGSAGPENSGETYETLWGVMKELKVEYVDEHFYKPKSWFFSSGNRYDNYDPKGPKVFAGEYACHIMEKWCPNSFETALAEAAFLTGVERNADVVGMTTYAPLLAHNEGWQWRPDLVWFDNLRVLRTPNWYVQYLYGNNKGTRVVPLTMNGKAVAGNEDQNGLFASAVWDEPTSTYIVKVANVSETSQPISLNFKGLKKNSKLTHGKVITLHSDNLDSENSFDDPDQIVPVESEIPIEGNILSTDIGAMTFAVYKLKLQ